MLGRSEVARDAARSADGYGAKPPCSQAPTHTGAFSTIGAVGTGKKLAAALLCRLLRALGVASGMVATTTTLDQMVLDVRRDVQTVIIDGLGGNAVESNKCVYIYIY